MGTRHPVCVPRGRMHGQSLAATALPRSNVNTLDIVKAAQGTRRISTLGDHGPSRYNCDPLEPVPLAQSVALPITAPEHTNGKISTSYSRHSRRDGAHSGLLKTSREV